MSQEFQRHPVIEKYEASRDGVVRHCKNKKPIGWDNGMGYLIFRVGRKIYLNHRFVYEVYNGSIKDGFVIDHIDGIRTHNSLNNLRAVTQSENTASGNTGTCKSIGKRPVKSINIDNKEMVFQSMSEAGKYFDIHTSSVQKVADGIYKTAFSKYLKNKIRFVYV